MEWRSPFLLPGGLGPCCFKDPRRSGGTCSGEVGGEGHLASLRLLHKMCYVGSDGGVMQ